ncbi:MAG: PEP-CTERM sorting domain-containing protein [Phycisphaerales bacterium]
MNKTRRLPTAMAACACATASITFHTSADVADVGLFWNTGGGTIHYEGSFAQHIASTQQGDRGQYTVINIDIAGIMLELGSRTLLSISVIDGGENVYTSAPGADVDLFRLNDVDPASYEFIYNGPTVVHQNEIEAQLRSRVNSLNWGTGNGTLSAGTFASLGEYGRLTARFLEPYILEPGGNGFNNGGNFGGGGSGFTIDLSEAGTIERFRVEIEYGNVPAPGAMALLGLAGLCARGRRRRHV